MAPSGKGIPRTTRRSRTFPSLEAEASSSLEHEAETSALTVDDKAEVSASTQSLEVMNPSKLIDVLKFESGYFCGCSTPKAKMFRIPEISTCPPAPKKRRTLDSSFSSIQRSPISFFAPPDLELFFI